ncbi:MAG TPA: methylated-DNA--[protein]-cysteine S-methyltransferase [Hyphomicrobiaceae bacterium]|nr:methylated-DNA--[protein]-cysteine S-methyltransferase [Hyphomicrobiaceae bacterium]
MPYHLFDTAFGTCAIAWSDAGLTRVQLPEATREATEARMRRAGTNAAEPPPPAFAADAVTALQSYFSRAPVSLDELRLDESIVSTFNASIYRALRAVPRGATVTYGDLAIRIGQPGAARAVGMAMGRNPWPVIVPCHRVLARGGKMGGFSAPGGTATKERLLALEDVTVGDPVLPGLFEQRRPS